MWIPLKSRFLIAVIAFGALSLFAGFSRLCAAAPLAFPYRSWTAWAIEDFLKQKQPAKVVFLGSSLVLVPLAGVDADTLHKRLDATEHHQCLYFEARLREKTGICASTYNFALPGEMPSDACLITSFLLKGAHKPDVIVYGVGPRDFMDNLLPSAASTDPYHFLSRFGDVTAWVPLLMPDRCERFNYELGQLIYFYRQKADIADKLDKAASAYLDCLLPASGQSTATTDFDKHQMLPEYRPFELKRGEAFFRPSTKEDHAKFVDNLSEYKKRYKNLKLDTFMTQLNFFRQALAAARKNGTHVVVAAMPITELNRKLISDASFQAYKSSIRTIAAAENASFIDFNLDKDFTQKDFGDTVHLHSGGGRRFLDKVVDRLAGDQQTISALEPKRGVALSTGGAGL